MMIPDLDNLIKAIECDAWSEPHCEHCPYGYGYLDTSGDHFFWTCKEEKKWEDALFYLKLYQHLIQEGDIK